MVLSALRITSPLPTLSLLKTWQIEVTVDQHLLAKPLETFSRLLMKGVNVVKERKACASFLLASTRCCCQVQLCVVPTWKTPVARFSCLLFCYYSFSKHRLGLLFLHQQEMSAFRPGNITHSMIQWLHTGRSSSLQSFCLPAAPPSSPWDYLTLWLTILEPYEDMVDYEEKYVWWSLWRIF